MRMAWHPSERDPGSGGPEVERALEADLRGRHLRVEHRAGEDGWRWSVGSAHGRELAAGIAGDAEDAEREAEEEVYRLHVGDGFAWWVDA